MASGVRNRRNNRRGNNPPINPAPANQPPAQPAAAPAAPADAQLVPAPDPVVAQEGPIALIRTREYSAVNKIPDREHLTDKNWFDWKERMARVFVNCHIGGYINGTILKPVPEEDGVGARNWVMNDNWAQQVILDNITKSQMDHVRSKRTAHAMYTALASTHEDVAYSSANNIDKLLHNTSYED